MTEADARRVKQALQQMEPEETVLWCSACGHFRSSKFNFDATGYQVDCGKTLRHEMACQALAFLAEASV